MANVPILYQNIMAGMSCEFSRDVFMWASDKFENDSGLYKAEAFAQEAGSLIPSIKGLLDLVQITGLMYQTHQARCEG